MTFLRKVKSYLFKFKFFSQIISFLYIVKNLFFYQKLILIKNIKEFYVHYTSFGKIPYYHPLSNAEKYLKENYDNFFLFYDLKKNDYIIELGSGIGTETLIISSKIGKNGKIFCFEPNIDVFKLLKINKKINSLNNSKLFNLALYKERSFIGFEKDNDDWIGGNINFNSKNKILSTTLNEIVKKEKLKKINFCKINIEGAEKFILYNSDKFFKICENLAVECHDFLNKPEYRTKTLVKKFLIKKGYKIFNIKKKNHINSYTKYYIYAKKI